MVITTVTLARNEVRMLWNQFKRTIRTPSMLMFYGITIIGVYFVSIIITTVLSFGPVVFMLGVLVEDVLDRGTVFAAMGVLTLSSIVGGYFGLGPAAVLTEDDESIILGAPIKPYQLFMSRYVRRLVRKTVFIFAGLVAIFPIVSSANILFIPLFTLLITTIIFFEVNYFLGGIASYFKVKLQQKTSNPIRHLLVLLLAFLALLPTMPSVTSNSVESMIFPSNAFAYIVTEITGILSWGYGPLVGLQFLALGFLISFLFLS
ncbi:MAG: hypothetical protein PVI03_06605, partial [Candidatus Thorarchaeota archaeon]